MKGYWLVWHGIYKQGWIPPHSQCSREEYARYSQIKDGETLLCIPESALQTNELVKIIEAYAAEKGLKIKLEQEGKNG